MLPPGPLASGLFLLSAGNVWTCSFTQILRRRINRKSRSIRHFTTIGDVKGNGLESASKIGSFREEWS
jgi:hypothetical protein